MVFILPFFSLVNYVMTLNIRLLLLIFRLSSISLHCSPINSFLASSMPFLIPLIIFIYLSAPPGLFFPLFNTLLLSHFQYSSFVTHFQYSSFVTHVGDDPGFINAVSYFFKHNNYKKKVLSSRVMMDLFMFLFSSKCNNNESLHESFLADFFLPLISCVFWNTCSRFVSCECLTFWEEYGRNPYSHNIFTTFRNNRLADIFCSLIDVDPLQECERYRPINKCKFYLI